MLKALFVSFCILTACIVSATKRNAAAVEEVIRKREHVVSEIAERAEELFRRRENVVHHCTCSTHDCSNDFGPNNEMECTSELLFETCEQECKSRLVNYEKTVIRTPHSTNPKVLTPSLKQSICTFKSLEPEFRDVRTKHGLTNSWTYIGFQDGHFRTWPSRARGRNPSEKDPFIKDCRPYDPRRRPWYNAASTGPKDVVLLVDRSLSTVGPSGKVGDHGSIWASAQQAVLKILDTFIHADYVNVVLYSSETDVLWKETPFAEAVPTNRDKLKNLLRQALPHGSTNVVAGFEKAIDLFIEAEETNTTSRCNKIIIYLAEGFDTEQPTSEILKRIDKLQDKLESKTGTRAHIFAYSIGPVADDSTAQQIACANQGLFSTLRNFDDPLSDMLTYLSTIATTRGSQGAVWVDVYEDTSGLGNVTTVSFPVFSRGNEGDLPMLVGVVGHDVILNDLVVGGYTHEEVLQEIVERSKKCERLQTQSCDLQVWRYIDDHNKQCPDVYPQHTCYQYGTWYYRRFGQQKNQLHAEAHCQNMGGRLAPIRSAEHLRFLSALSSADKSWIGGERIRGRDPMEFRFSDPDVPVIDQYDFGWAKNNPGDLRESCVTIDRRSTSGNLESQLCESVFDFICEFQSEEAAECAYNTLRVTSETGMLKTFNVPYPLECRQMEKALRDARPVEAAIDLSPKDVICDFGRPVFHEELYCCPECHNNSFHKISNSATRVATTNLFVIYVSLLLLILLFHI